MGSRVLVFGLGYGYFCIARPASRSVCPTHTVTFDLYRSPRIMCICSLRKTLHLEESYCMTVVGTHGRDTDIWRSHIPFDDSSN